MQQYNYSQPIYIQYINYPQVNQPYDINNQMMNQQIIFPMNIPYSLDTQEISPPLNIDQNQIISQNQNYLQNQNQPQNQNIQMYNIPQDQNITLNQNIPQVQNITLNQNILQNQNIVKNPNIPQNQILIQNLPQNQILAQNLNIPQNHYFPQDQNIPQNHNIPQDLNITLNQNIPQNTNIILNPNIHLIQNLAPSDNNTLNKVDSHNANMPLNQNIVLSENTPLNQHISLNPNITTNHNNTLIEPIPPNQNIAISQNITLNKNIPLNEKTLKNHILNTKINQNPNIAQNRDIPENTLIIPNENTPQNQIIPLNQIIPTNQNIPLNENIVLDPNNNITQNIPINQAIELNPNILVNENIHLDDIPLSNSFSLKENMSLNENISLNQNQNIDPNQNIVLNPNIALNENVVQNQNNSQNENIPLPNEYRPPIGSRLPIEKNHHPFKIIISKKDNNNNNNYNETDDNQNIKENKNNNALVIIGQKYEINEYAEILKKILDNKATDEEEIIRIIENTNYKERQSIKKMYNQKFNENLIKRFQKELNGEFKEAVIGSFMAPAEYDAYCLHNSLKASKIKDDSLTEIIGSRNNSELKLIKKFYALNYGESLKNDIMGETYGDYQKFLLALLQCQRSTSSQPNTNSCANDASDLFKLGEKRRGIDDETFIRIFTTSSPIEITLTNHFYKQQTGKGLLGAIESEFEFSGDTKELLNTIVRVQVDHYGYYANKIHDSIENSNNYKLIRQICSRYTIDLPIIKKVYIKDYENDLLQDMQNKISTNFGKVIYSLASKTQ